MAGVCMVAYKQGHQLVPFSSGRAVVPGGSRRLVSPYLHVQSSVCALIEMMGRSRAAPFALGAHPLAWTPAGIDLCHSACCNKPLIGSEHVTIIEAASAGSRVAGPLGQGENCFRRNLAGFPAPPPQLSFPLQWLPTLPAWPVLCPRLSGRPARFLLPPSGHLWPGFYEQ